MRTADCQRCEELLLDYLYGELDDAGAEVVAAHLEDCAECAARAREWRSAMGALDALRDEQAPVDSTEAAREALAREMLLARPAATSRIPRRVFGGALAAAATLLVAFGAWYFLTPPPGPSPVPKTGSQVAILQKPGVPPGAFQGRGAENIRRGNQLWADAVVLHEAYELTVFNDDLALVKDKRRIVNLNRGENTVKFADVAAMIDPTSVRFESATDPLTTKVLEQNYEFDLATPDALLKKYIDRKIACVTKDGQIVEGYLASYEMGSGAAFDPGGQNEAEAQVFSESNDPEPPVTQVKLRQVNKQVEQIGRASCRERV